MAPNELTVMLGYPEGLPVLIDGGIRRGADIFKSSALGANVTCIGRPYCWGLGAKKGVEMVRSILKIELLRDMKLAGTPTLVKISSNSMRDKHNENVTQIK